MKTLPLIIAAILAGVAAGFFLGRQSFPQQRSVHQDGGSSRGGGEAFLTDDSDASAPAARTGATTNSSESAVRPITAAQLSSELDNLQLFENFGASLQTLAELQKRIRASDIKALAVEFCASNAVPKRGMGMFGTHLVLEALAGKDPQQAWELATSTAPGPARTGAVMSVINTLVRQDPDRAFAMIAALPDAELRRQGRAGAIGALSASDPGRAFSLAIAEPEPAANMAIATVLSRWVRTDPDAAKSAIASIQGPLGERARESLIRMLGYEDPAAAWEYAKQLPPPATNDSRSYIIAQWARTDPRAALDAALTIQQSVKRNEAVGAAVGAWGNTDFDAALAYATTVGDSGMRAEILSQLSRQSQGDPQKMLDAVLEHMPPGESFTSSVNNIVNSWSKNDPSGAAAAVAALPPGATMFRAARSLASSWLSSGGKPDDILRWIGGLPQGKAQEGAYASLFSTWSGKDPLAAVQALSRISGSARKDVMESIAGGWSSLAPEEALRWATSAPATPDERNSLIGTTVSRMAASSPEKAAAAVLSLPEAHRAKAMESLMNQWSSKDMTAAARWLDKQPASAAKNTSLRTLANEVAKDDPHSAMSWANNISDTGEKHKTMERIARQWMRNDPAAASAWIANSPLPPETRKNLMK